MRKRIFFCLAILLIAAGGGPGMADPLSDPSTDTPILPDPVPNNEVFPLGLATEGVAVASPVSSSGTSAPAGHVAGCSALNPCAVPTPALDRSPVVTNGNAVRHQ